ncbi:tape measure protein [Rhodococcus phage Peregrin]|nr:tape measure protein [Rhodococcus phage Peregrin]
MGNTVRVDIEGHESVSRAVDQAIAKLKELDRKDIDVDIDISTKEASAKIKELEAQIKALGDHTVHVKIDTGQARDKLTYLHARLQALGDKVIKIDIDTEKARDKIRYLHNRMDALENKKIKIDVDTEKARDKIRYLFNRADELSDNKIVIDADTTKARSKLTYLKSKVDDLTDGHVEIDVDNAGALAKIAEVQAALNALSDRTINIDINDKASDKIDRAFKNASRKSAGARRNDSLADTNAALREIEKRQRGNERIKMGVDPDWEDFDDEVNKRQSKSVIKYDVDTTVVDEKLGKIFKRGDEIISVKVVMDEDGNSTISDMRNLNAELDRIKDHKIKFDIETRYDDDGSPIARFLKTGRQRESLELDFDLKDHEGLLAKAYALQERSAHFNLNVDDDTREFIRRLDEKSTKRIDFELEARDIEGRLSHILREDNKVIRILADDDAMNRTLKDLGKDRVVRYRVERIDNDGEIEDWLHVGDRSVRVDLDVDDAEALARIAAATRDRTVKTRMVVDRDNRGLGGALSLLGITDNDVDRDVRRTGRVSRGVSALTNVMSAVPSAATRMATSITSGLAAVTTRIPVLGGIFKISSGITEQFTKMGSSGAALGKIAGPIGAIGTAGVAAAAGLGILGTIGVIGTGALTGGMYVLQAAMGAVVGVTSLLSAAVGGALAGGFIYFASKAPEVGEAFSALGDHVSKTMEDISSVVVPSLVRSADKMKGAFDIMRPSLERMAEGTGKLVDQMSDKLPSIAAKLGPAMEQAFKTGAKHLNALGDAMPGIVEGLGNFFDKIGSPAVMEATKRVWGALPGMIEGTGDAINWTADKYNDLSKFLKSDEIKDLKDGWHDFSEELSGTDWTMVKEGVKGAMNSFGDFVGNIDGENIAQTVSGITGAFTQLTNLATNINLDGMVAGLAMGLEGAAELLNNMVTTVKAPFVMSARQIEWAGDVWGDFQNWLGVTPNEPLDLTVDVNVIPKLSNTNNTDADLPKKIQEIVDAAPDGGRQTTKVEVPMEVLPKLMENGGLAMAEVTTILRDMKLPPTKINVPVEAAPELKEAGVIDAAEFKRLMELPAGTMVEYDVPVAALPKLLETGAIDAGQFSRLLAGIPPAQVDIALKALPKLVEAGVISADQMSEILYQTGVYELPIDVMAIPRMLARREISVSEIISQIGELPPIQKDVVVDALIRLRNSGQLSLEDFDAIMAGLNVEIPADIVPQMGNLEAAIRRTNITMDVDGKIDGARLTEQLAGIEAIINANPKLGETGTLLGALNAMEATIKANPEMENADGLLRTIAAMRARIPADVVPQPLGSESNLPKIPVEGELQPLAPPAGDVKVPVTGDMGALMGQFNSFKPNVDVHPLMSDSGLLLGQLNNLNAQIDVDATIGSTEGLLGSLENLQAKIIATPVMEGKEQLLAALEGLIVKIKTELENPAPPAIPDIPPVKIQTEIGEIEVAPWIAKVLASNPKIQIPVEPKFDGIMGKQPDLPAIDQPVRLKKDLSQVQTALPPITQDVIVRRKAEPSVAANLQTIETKTVRLIPDTSALQAIVVPPINVQLNVQSNAAQVQGLIAMIPLSITTQHTVQSNAAAVAGSIQQIPLSMNTQHTVSSNVADISNQVRSIPATMLTEHTTTTNTQATIDLVNSIPKSSQTDHTVNTNVDSALSRIRSLSGQNTSSTHTVNVVVNGGGGLPGGASISAFSGMAGAAASPMMGMMGAASSGGSTLFGAAGATGGLSNNFKFSQKTGGSLLKVATIVKGGIVKAWEDVGSSGGKSFMEGLAESLDAISKIINEVVNIGNSIKEMMEALNPKPEGLENAAKDIADASKDIDKNLSNTADSVQTNAEKITNAAKFDPNIQGLQQIWGQVGQKIDTAFSTGISSAQNTIGTAFSEIQATLAKPFQTLPEINLDQIVKGDFSSVFAGIEQKKAEFTQAFESVKQTALNAVPGLNDAFNKVGQDIGAAFGWGVDESIASMRAKNPEIASVLDTFTANATGIQTAWQNAGTQIGTAFQTGVDQTKALVTSKIQEVKGLIDAPIAAQPQIDMPAVLGGNFDSVLAAINTKKTEFEQAFMGIGNVATTTGPQIQATWSQMGTTMGTSFTGALDQSKMLMQQAVDAAKQQLELPQTFTPNVQALPQAMDQNLNGLVQSIQQKKPEVDAAMTQLTQGAAQAAPPTTSEHKINSNIAEVTAQINSLNGMVTTSTHMINVVTLGGGPGVAGIAGISGMAASPMGAMGLAGEGENGLMGAAGAGEMTSNFRYTNGSGGSLLQISNLVKDGIITAWEGLGEEVGKSFANGISNSQVLVVDKIGDIVGLAGKTITVKQLVDVQGEVIGSIVEVGDTVSSIADVTSSVGNLENVLGSVGNVISAVGGFGGALGILGPIGQIISSIGTLFGLFGGWFGQHKGGAFVSSGSLNESGQMVHYNTQQTVNNHFDGGLLGDPERQAKKVLDVLELAGSGRRANAVLGNGASV